MAPFSFEFPCRHFPLHDQPHTATLNDQFHSTGSAHGCSAPLSVTVHAGILQDPQGYWLGDLTLPGGTTFNIGTEIFTRAEGSVWASVASSDQGTMTFQ